jgi:hypothetical protein
MVICSLYSRNSIVIQLFNVMRENVKIELKLVIRGYLLVILA